MKIEIHNTELWHLPQLAKVYKNAYDKFPEAEEKWTVNSAYRLMEYMFNVFPELCFTILVDEEIAGAIMLEKRPYWDGDYLAEGELFVDPKFQKLSLGKRLMLHAFKHAKEIYNITKWETYTYKHSEHPLKWYKRLGFEISDTMVVIQCELDEVIKNIEKEMTEEGQSI